MKSMYLHYCYHPFQSNKGVSNVSLLYQMETDLMNPTKWELHKVMDETNSRGELWKLND